MKNKKMKIGRIILAAGILLLISGIICTMTVGTLAVPILLSSSILINSVGIFIIKTYQHDPKEEDGE